MKQKKIKMAISKKLRFSKPPILKNFREKLPEAGLQLTTFRPEG
jgi:hypothetical protein